MAILNMADIALSGKRVLIREDLNVPVDDGVVTSDARILAFRILADLRPVSRKHGFPCSPSPIVSATCSVAMCR
jgi:3-phosphoglycerate kinase